MPRPTVLVATTNPAMAYALQESLKEKCKSLGLKLEVCPDGDESKVGDANVRIYDSAEALFDALEKRDPMELADTLVVLDVGAHLEDVFSCAVSGTSEQGGWHVTSQRRAGVAVELLLRFPQVFPVFLSPAVPMVGSEYPSIPSCYKHKQQTGQTVGKCESGCWKGFNSLLEELAVKHRRKVEGKEEFERAPLDIQYLFALAVPLHFVSPLDQGAGLKSTLERFARGMRCWFDPTGLRTLVKNRFLGTVFGNKVNWENTWPADNSNESRLREVLLGRLTRVAVAVDEEREFALLNSYASWKYGRRAWMVTTYGEFSDGLWKYVSGSTGEDTRDVIVLRDVDIRFPDIPETSGIRAELRDIGSKEWKEKYGDRWCVRAISSDASFKKNMNGDALRLGQDPINITNNGSADYFGFSKPVGSIYELNSVLDLEANQVDQSVLSLIGVAKDKGGGGHGAPYSNLAMSEGLLRHSASCKDSPSAHFIGALLAMEAFELLLGMSKTTALEALLAVHKHEVAAEVSFPGISHAVDIEERKKDVDATLKSLYRKNVPSSEQENETQKKDSERIKRMYLSQFWSELRIQYREGEQFEAAENANIQSLLNSYKWLRIWLLRPATSLGWWFVSAFFLSILFATGYAAPLKWQPDCNGILYFFHIWWEVVMSMLSMQPGGDAAITVAAKSGDGYLKHILELFHMAISYVLLGLLISMLYRKITRS